MNISLLELMPAFKKKCTPSYVSHYIFLDSKGVVHEQDNDICFARFVAGDAKYGGGEDHRGIVKARVFINQHIKQGWEKDYIEYAKYITQESPYRFAFMNRDDLNYSFENGFAVDCKFGPSYLMAGMTALREGYEYYTNLAAWTRLVSKGMDKGQAFILAGFLAWSGKYYYDQHKMGHGALPTNFHKKDAKAFLEKGLRFFLNDKEKPLNQLSKGWNVFHLHDPIGAYGLEQNKETVKETLLEGCLHTVGRKELKEGWNKVYSYDEEDLIAKYKEWLK